jgi:hypothetical protein
MSVNLHEAKIKTFCIIALSVIIALSSENYHTDDIKNFC